MNGQGHEDPVDALRYGPKRGLLVVRKRFVNSANISLTAELFALDGSKNELLPALDYVKLIAENEKGKVIEGIQSVFLRATQKARREQFTQRWLCKLPGLPAVLDTEKLLKRSAKRLSNRLISGFDPLDDNLIN
jgi:hypothetical protein